MSMFDLSNVLNSANKVQENEEKKDNNRGNRKKLLYPQDGTVKVKLLFNPKSGIALRKIGRHHVHGAKVPCLQMYGQDCPVCKTVADIKSVKGSDLWEYKRRERGVSYAQFIGDNYNRQNEKEDRIPKEGEVILLMYPWSVYRDLQSIIAEAGENASSILATNQGKVVKISRSKGKSNRVEYRVEIDAFSDYQSANTDDDYMAMLNDLPNLNEEIVGPELDEKTMKKIKEVNNKLHESYLSPAVLGSNGGAQSNNQPNNLGQFVGNDPNPNQGNVPAWAQQNPAQNQQMDQNPNQGTQPNMNSNPNQNFNQDPTQNFNQNPNQNFNQNSNQNFNQSPNQNSNFNQGSQPDINPNPNQSQLGSNQPVNNPGQQNMQQLPANNPNQQFQQQQQMGNQQPPAQNQNMNTQQYQQPVNNGNSQQQTPTSQESNTDSSSGEQSDDTPGDPSVLRADGKPSCFGQHGSVDPNHCLICPFEVECTGATA